jgi:hypothetical protein
MKMTRRVVPAAVIASLLVMTGMHASQNPAPRNLPYTAVHDPQFISAADATFMNHDDRVIGLMAGNVAKAYPAGILSQHGLVEDRSPNGPIAITW